MATRRIPSHGRAWDHYLESTGERWPEPVTDDQDIQQRWGQPVNRGYEEADDRARENAVYNQVDPLRHLYPSDVRARLDAENEAERQFHERANRLSPPQASPYPPWMAPVTDEERDRLERIGSTVPGTHYPEWMLEDERRERERRERSFEQMLNDPGPPEQPGPWMETQGDEGSGDETLDEVHDIYLRLDQEDREQLLAFARDLDQRQQMGTSRPTLTTRQVVAGFENALMGDGAGVRAQQRFQILDHLTTMLSRVFQDNEVRWGRVWNEQALASVTTLALHQARLLVDSATERALSPRVWDALDEMVREAVRNHARSLLGGRLDTVPRPPPPPAPPAPADAYSSILADD